MKFLEKDGAEMIPARVANVKCPQVVIQFYEKRLIWHSEDEQEADSGDEAGTKQTPRHSINGADGDSPDANGSIEDEIVDNDSS